MAKALTINLPPNKHLYLNLSNWQVFDFTLNANSQLECFYAGQSVKDLKLEINVKLVGKKAAVEFRGALIATKQSQDSVKILVEHLAKDTISEIVFKVLGQDQSHTSISGLVRIEKSAAGAVSSLKQDALLLSPQSRITNIPNLEILNNDVQASHSATVGQLDEVAIFYLTSRGLSRKQATELLIKAFLHAF